ncbi:site-specific integrase [Shewanella yunxiaonensis]|uniref:Site-specific integrase n=1 Tax=Shewanella yunxiaonensis TaxID=2829809 RepID=A0ABX7YVU2_9GAMM|nr:site-specific integrase [Shewanella yunxiaonensis]QUN06918.1 site-specific integrase [Shewanella yunxiaonensis]
MSDLVWTNTNHASQIRLSYEKDKQQLILSRHHISSILIALSIAFDVAPLSLKKIVDIINNRQSIDYTTSKPCLRIYHAPNKNEQSRFYTHYALPPFVLRLLTDFYAQNAEPITEINLLNSINDWAKKNKLTVGKPITWQRRFQCRWFTHYKIPPMFLKDMSYPERHVGRYHDQPTNTPLSHIYEITWNECWFESRPLVQATAVKWPHKALLKSSHNARSKLETNEPDWHSDNILPQMLYLYTINTIRFGGLKKEKLALSTIEQYTNLENRLEHFPLSYSDATNEDSLNRWAHNLYRSVDTENSQKHIQYFLNFMSTQELTEDLDINAFNFPTSKPSVNPYRIDIDGLTDLTQTLLIAPTSNPFRSLFAVTSCLLGTFGMLRRGEVMRLRNRDIVYTHSTGQLELYITHTSEGRTKSGKSRNVYTVIPKQFRDIFHYVINLKKQSNNELPFIGFEGESLHSRQLYYLSPVSRTLKCLFGQKFGFHQLRHTGIHYFVQQALHLVSQLPEVHRGETALEREIFSNETIDARFEYWLELANPAQINDGLLLDEVCAQIGHESWSTTRWSYLHGIDWLLKIISPPHHCFAAKAYSKEELKYLLGLPPSSKELYRRVRKLTKRDCYSTDVPEQKSQKISLSEDCLSAAIHKVKAPTPPKISTACLPLWFESLDSSQLTLLGYIFTNMQRGQNTDFGGLSKIWSHGCKHLIESTDKQRVTALKTLPKIELSTDSNSLSMTLACNIKNARAFTKFFRHKDWKWLVFHFTLSTNRKLRSDRQEKILKTEFAQPNDVVTLKKHAVGDTTLTISFHPKPGITLDILQYSYQYLLRLRQDEER